MKIDSRSFIARGREAIEGDALDDVTVIGVVTFTICDVRQDNDVVYLQPGVPVVLITSWRKSLLSRAPINIISPPLHHFPSFIQILSMVVNSTD